MGRKTWQPSPCERVLLGLARGVVDREALASCRPEKLTVLARQHKVLFPLAALVGGEPTVSGDWKLWAARVSLSSQADQDRLKAGLEKTLALLAGAGLRAVVLKGPSLALGRPRDMGDADLLLPPGLVPDAIAVLETHGYLYQGYERNLRIRRSEYRRWDRLLRWSNQFEFLDPETGLLVELHSALFEAGRVYPERLGAFQGDPKPFLDRAVTEGPHRFLCLEDRVLLLAVHLGVKRAPVERSFVLRHILDLAALEAAGPDWAAVQDRADALKCAHHLYLLTVVSAQFRSSEVLERLAGALEARLSKSAARLVRLHARCLRGLSGYDGPRLLLYRFLAPFQFRGTPGARFRAALVVPLVLLPRHELARVYRVPGRSPWLPVLYLLEPFRLVGQALAFLRRRLDRPR